MSAGRRFRIGAVHALMNSIGPTQAAFDRRWPVVDVAHLLDGSLYLDRSRGTANEAEVASRVERLIAYSAATGAEGVIFTGSFFGDAVKKVRGGMTIPVVTSFDGIIERALKLDCPLHILATAPDSVTLLMAELQREATQRSRGVSLSGHTVADALDALIGGDPDRHDHLVVEAVRAVDIDAAILFAQFSMERAYEQVVTERDAPVIGPATEAVARLSEQVTRS